MSKQQPKGSFRVCFCCRRMFRIKVSEPPLDVKKVFQRYSENGKMSVDHLHWFLTDFQGEKGATKEDAEAICNSLKHLSIFPRKELNLESFFRYLLSDSNPPSLHLLCTTAAIRNRRLLSTDSSNQVDEPFKVEEVEIVDSTPPIMLLMYVYYRSGKPSIDESWANNVIWHKGNLLSDDSLKEAFNGVKAVISCVGGFGSNSHMYKINGTANINAIRAAAEQATRGVEVSRKKADTTALPSHLVGLLPIGDAQTFPDTSGIYMKNTPPLSSNNICFHKALSDSDANPTASLSYSRLFLGGRSEASQIGDRFISRKLIQKLYDRALTIGLQDYAKRHQPRYTRLADWDGIAKILRSSWQMNYLAIITFETHEEGVDLCIHQHNFLLPLLWMFQICSFRGCYPRELLSWILGCK